MNTIEMQHNLIKKILKISDNQFLAYLNSIISENKETSEYDLNEFEKEMISKSQKDHKAGKIISNEEVFLKTKKWLGE